jgi:hypothetical protein
MGSILDRISSIEIGIGIIDGFELGDGLIVKNLVGYEGS